MLDFSNTFSSEWVLRKNPKKDFGQHNDIWQTQTLVLEGAK